MKKNLTTKPPPPRPITVRSVPIEIAENAEAKKEYCRVLALLAGKTDERDRSLLIDYALTYSEIIELRDLIMDEGRTLCSGKGGVYINPTVNLLISRQSHMANLRRDLYFTPKSRIEKQTRVREKGDSIRDRVKNEHDDDIQD